MGLSLHDWLLVKSSVANNPCMDSLPSNATDVDFDRFFDILLIAMGFLHVSEHIYLLTISIQAL